MSFIKPPVGLVYDAAKSGAVSVVLGDEFDVGTEYPCEIPDPLPEDPSHTSPVPCPQNVTDSQSYTLTVADATFDPSADFFAVAVRVRGPRLSPGFSQCRDPFIPGASPCVERDDALYDGTVDGGDYLRRTGVTVAAAYEAEPDIAGFALTHWPNPAVSVEEALLVNPAPTWPVPDVEGNEYGNVLFTLAQLPATITTAVAHYNHDIALRGAFSVRVEAYVYGEEGDEPIQRVCLVGAA